MPAFEEILNELNDQKIYEQKQEHRSNIHPLQPGNVISATDSSMYGIIKCDRQLNTDYDRSMRALGEPQYCSNTTYERFTLELEYIKTQEGKRLTHQIIRENPFMRSIYEEGYQTAQKVTERNYGLQIIEMRNKIIDLERQLKPLKHNFRGFKLGR